jgi:hypothetical protein
VFSKKEERENFKELQFRVKKLESELLEVKRSVLYYETGNRVKAYSSDGFGGYGVAMEKDETITLDIAVKAIQKFLKVKFKKLPALGEKYIAIKDK